MSIIKLLLEKSAAWQRKEGKDPKGGLNKKGVASYRRENPGSKLQTAVTEKPSKLKKGSKKAKRRLSFCRRMKGMKRKLTSAKTARDPDSRINKSLRKWNCESYSPEMQNLIESLKKACWKGYEAIGMKKKGGRKVPNCVPVTEEVVNKEHKGKMSKSMRRSRDKCAKTVKGIKAIKGKDNEENAKHRYCTYIEWKKHK
jgi:hypothetical protein